MAAGGWRVRQHLQLHPRGWTTEGQSLGQLSHSARQRYELSLVADLNLETEQLMRRCCQQRWHQGEQAGPVQWLELPAFQRQLEAPADPNAFPLQLLLQLARHCLWIHVTAGASSWRLLDQYLHLQSSLQLQWH